MTEETRIQLKELPEYIIKMYMIREYDDGISIHTPAYINIDDEFTLIEREHVYVFETSKISVSVWKDVKNLHITVF